MDGASKTSPPKIRSLPLLHERGARATFFLPRLRHLAHQGQ
jgi:hypothetical protein